VCTWYNFTVFSTVGMTGSQALMNSDDTAQSQHHLRQSHQRRSGAHIIYVSRSHCCKHYDWPLAWYCHLSACIRRSVLWLNDTSYSKCLNK